MPRDPLFNFDELLAPIPGDDPAGPKTTYLEMRPQFEELRREVTPEQAGETKEEVKNADWRGMERKTRAALAGSSKDLRIAGHLLEALVKEHGFAGAHDGLKLFRLLVEQCWDRLNPPADPEDPEVRAGPFQWLDDPFLGLRFPTTLRQAPLLVGPEKAYAYFDCRGEGQGEAGRAMRAEVDRAVETMPAESLAAVLGEVRGCGVELGLLTDDLQKRLGPASPAMSAIRQALDECRVFLEQVLQKRPGGATETDKASGDGAPAAPGATASRAEIYRQIGQAALRLRELEPHSPIPYLLLRAVELGQMPFPQLMQELVRDPGSLTELKREFGIKDAASPSR